MAISKVDVEHVANLARIKISSKEKAQFVQEFGAILDYISELESAPTGDVEEIPQISGLENIVRADKITESFNRDLMLENAPDKKDGFIKVKQILE